MTKALFLSLLWIISAFSMVCQAQTLKDEELTPTYGWWFPYTGRLSGSWETGLGVHFWTDHLMWRNLQFRSTLNLAPGIRVHNIIRSNHSFDSLTPFDPFFDELYAEGYGFHTTPSSKFSANIKLGRLRYLRFPYPDITSMFDQVPGMEDLTRNIQSAYQGALLSLEYARKSGLGYHVQAISWIDSTQTGANFIENFLFYRKKFGVADLEVRVGDLQKRTPPLGRSGPGYSIYLGGNWRKYKVGLLFEDIETEPIRTGVLVEFAPSIITKLLGCIRFDYTRSPEGFVLQIPVAAGLFNLKTTAPKGSALVGKVIAERTITYWQNGQGRNFYEHIISRYGMTNGDDLVVVITKEPWYLRIESLVSPKYHIHTWDDLIEWERKRQGPAQLAQRVTYSYFK